MKPGLLAAGVNRSSSLRLIGHHLWLARRHQLPHLAFASFLLARRWLQPRCEGVMP